MHNGYATFHAVPEGQDVYEVLTSKATLTPRGKAMFRVDVDSSEERVEVFHGSVEVASSLGSWALAKNSVLDLNPGTEQPAQLSEGITQDDWDRWVQDRESQAEAASNALSPSGYSNSGSDAVYGWSDLAYYGNWSYISGFGYGWIPNVGAGWFPYSLGHWCWYPGFGWVWISADPWGWLPYHYGGWEFIPGVGWVWFPGIFGPWSPGLVTWYGGPGWIGWRPRHGLPGGGRIYPCGQGQSCGIAVSTNAFRKGHPVGPATIFPVNVESGKKMEQPDILPERQATLPGPVVAPPAEFANPKLIIIGGGSATLGLQSINTQPATPAPGAVAGSSRALGGSAVGSVARHGAPWPGPGIVYDPAAGRYVNNSHLPSGATESPSEPSVRTLPLAPGTSALRAAQPAPRTPPNGGVAAAPQSHGAASFHHSLPRSDSSSAAAPRSGGEAAGEHATGGSGSSGGGSTLGQATSGTGSSSKGSSMGGGSHAGGGSPSGGHH
jgi:hypothetical protein